MAHSQNLTASDLSINCLLSRLPVRTTHWLAAVLACVLMATQARAQEQPAGSDGGQPEANSSQKKN
ncbi:MAG: hypothetical protein VB858_01570, partial [Planctomycetaceae bacterium]